jgi:hypothetical protein
MSRTRRRLAVGIAVLVSLIGGAAAAGAIGTRSTESTRVNAISQAVDEAMMPSDGDAVSAAIDETDGTLEPGDPIDPVDPIGPADPVEPIDPIDPIDMPNGQNSIDAVLDAIEPGADTDAIPDEVVPDEPPADWTVGYSPGVIDNPEYDAYFADLTSSAFRMASSRPSVEKTGRVVSVTTLAGLQAAGLPEWVQLETLKDLGYDSWSAVPADVMDDRIDQIAFNFDAIALSEFVQQNPNPATLQTRGLCDAYWDPKNKSDSKVIDKKETPFVLDKSGDWWAIKASITGYFQGNVSYDINYSLKKRSCIGIPYNARLDNAKLEAQLKVGAQAFLEAKANKKWTKDFNHKFVPFRYGYNATVLGFEFDLSASVDITLGVRLEAEIDAHLKARVDAFGDMKYVWSCTAKSCEKTEARRNIKVMTSDDTEAALNINFAVIPYLEVGIQAGLKFIVPIARGRVAALIALPLRLHLAACLADLNGDGSFEGSLGAFVDVSIEIYAYYWYELLGWNGFGGIRIPINAGDPNDPDDNGWRQITSPANSTSMYTQYPGHDAPNASDVTITKATKVIFSLPIFSASSNVLRPVMRQTSTGIKVRPQACHPFEADPIYELDLGDGAAPVRTGKGVFARRFDGPGVVRARLVADGWGRSLISPWVEINVINSNDVVDQPDQIDPGATITPSAQAMNVSVSSRGFRDGGIPSAFATVKVTDKQGRPIEGATVHGEWTGAAGSTTFANTGSNGVAELEASAITAEESTMSFTVTAVEAHGFGTLTGTLTTTVTVSADGRRSPMGTRSNGLWSPPGGEDKIVSAMLWNANNVKSFDATLAARLGELFYSAEVVNAVGKGFGSREFAEMTFELQKELNINPDGRFGNQTATALRTAKFAAMHVPRTSPIDNVYVHIPLPAPIAAMQRAVWTWPSLPPPPLIRTGSRRTTSSRAVRTRTASGCGRSAGDSCCRIRTAAGQRVSAF